jgi:single-strand DNA-binding protein
LFGWPALRPFSFNAITKLNRPKGPVHGRDTQNTIIMFTEQLNKVELVGTVGSVAVNKVGDMKNVRLSLATEYSYRDNAGCMIIETTWHNVTAWEGEEIRYLEDISRGDRLHVVGRMRQIRYTSSDGTERTVYEVIASKLEKVSCG